MRRWRQSTPARWNGRARRRNRWQTLAAFRFIILPQGLRLALPSLGNYAVGLVKDTSLVAAIAAPEVMFNARQLVNETFETALIYGCAATIYLVLTMAVAGSVFLVERKLETH